MIFPLVAHLLTRVDIEPCTKISSNNETGYIKMVVLSHVQELHIHNSSIVNLLHQRHLSECAQLQVISEHLKYV